MQNKIEQLISELESQRDKLMEQIPLCKYPASKRIFEMRIEQVEHRIDQAQKLLDQNENTGENENDSIK